jgi:hypothetical protein
MMLKKNLAVAVSVVAICASTSALAFDLKLPTKPAEQSAAPSGGDAVGMQEGVVRKYVEGSKQLNTAQTELLYAFGLKDQAAALEAQAKALGSGATLDKDGIEKQKKLSDDANKAIQEKLDSGTQLTAEGKQHYVKSLSPYAAAVTITTKMPAELSAFSNAAQSQIQNSSVLEKAKVVSKLSAGTYLVKELPGYSANLLSCLGKLVSYANKNQIPVPKDATAALGN